MRASIQFRKDRNLFFVQWYDTPNKKLYKVYRYKGEYMYNLKIAEKLLALMQSDYESGTFFIEKYMQKSVSDVVPYLYEWLEIVKPKLSPATVKDYNNTIKNHLEPFFNEHPVLLSEIRYDLLMKLMNSINRSGKGKANVMYCLHRCLDFAYRSGRITSIPPFPEKSDYGIIEPAIQWLPEERQMNIINAIPEEHRSIFLFLKYHLRRPSEAMALQKEDYDPYQDVFIIRRTISARKLVERTKTGKQHIIPCHSSFKPIIEQIKRESFQILSPFFFTCPTGRNDGKRYTHTIMSKLWHNAYEQAGEKISMYAGFKHSSCSQYINERGLSESELQIITDHARLESVRRYAKTEVARKRELMERKIIRFKEIRDSSGV